LIFGVERAVRAHARCGGRRGRNISSEAFSKAADKSGQSEPFAQTLREQLAAVTGGMAPDVYVNAWWDWFLNVAKAPPKQLEIVQDGLAKAMDVWSFALRAAAGEKVAPAEVMLVSAARPGPSGRSISTHTATAITSIGGKRLGRTSLALRRRARGNSISSRETPPRPCLPPTILPPIRCCSARPAPRRARPGARVQQLARGYSAHARGKGPSGTEKFVVGRGRGRNARKSRAAHELAELIQYTPAHRASMPSPF